MSNTPQETTLLTARESRMRLVWWLKMLFTLGFYYPSWRGTRLIVTDRRVIYRKGLVSKDERSLPLNRIQDVSVSYGLGGRIFGYGDIKLEAAGESSSAIRFDGVAKPERIKKLIFQKQQ